MISSTRSDVHADSEKEQPIPETGAELKSFEPFKTIEKHSSRIEIADNLEILLSQYQLDSKLSKRYIFLSRLRNLITIIISVFLIIMGFGMIITPAPQYFEILTIYYFSWNDGITLMDLISLLIVFSGIYLLITALMRLGKQSL